MTADEFRSLALGLAGAVESSHMEHPDFRVGGKIFATLGYPDGDWGCLRLPLEEQARVVQTESKVFVPAKGAWGQAGATQVYLPLAHSATIQAALRIAWEYRQLKKNARPSVRIRKKVRAK